MNNKFKYDNIFLIDTYDNFIRILEILNENKEQKNLIILNQNSKKIKKLIKMFFNIKSFDYTDKKVIFGSKKTSLLGRIADHIIIFLNLIFFTISHKSKFSKYHCKNLFYFSPMNMLTFRVLINIIKHEKLKAYNFYKLRFFNKKHFLSGIYYFFFKINLDLCARSFRNNKLEPRLVGFKLKFQNNNQKYNKQNKGTLKYFIKVPKKSVLFIEDSFEQVQQSYDFGLDEKKTFINFEIYFKSLVKNNYKIYYKTHPSYPKKTKLFKKIYKKFSKNIQIVDNAIPSEIYMKSFKYISLGISSTQRSHFGEKIILNFKDFFEFYKKYHKNNFNIEFNSNLYSKNKRDNKYIFLNKKNVLSLNKFLLN